MKYLLPLLLIACGSRSNTSNTNGCYIKATPIEDPWTLSVEDCHYDRELRCHACVFVYKDNAKFQCVPGAPIGGKHVH